MATRDDADVIGSIFIASWRLPIITPEQARSSVAPAATPGAA
jgi:hypothetical protein